MTQSHSRPADACAASQAAIWLRLLNPSLTRMCWTWFSAVRSETNKVSPICLFVWPRATSPATSSSRGLSGDPAAAAAGSLARSRPIRSANGTMPSRSASPAAASSAARARSRSPGACRLISASASSTRAWTAYPRAPLASQIEAAALQILDRGVQAPQRRGRQPSWSSTGPM